MTSPAAGPPVDDDAPLVAGEGVNQGSALATDEAPAGPEVEEVVGTSSSSPGRERAAPPDDTESAESLAAHEAAGPGQQLEAGEG